MFMLFNNGTRTIETERLILRKFTMDDTESFYHNVGSDKDVIKYVVWNQHKDLDVTKRAVEKWISSYKQDFVFHWVIILKESKEAIGSISCVDVDSKNAVCELGYVISSKYWNEGYATETLKSIIDYLRKEGFHTICAKHLSLNPASGMVMKKCGMEFEGTLRKRMVDKNTGKYDDLLSYSIVFDD